MALLIFILWYECFVAYVSICICATCLCGLCVYVAYVYMCICAVCQCVMCICDMCMCAMCVYMYYVCVCICAHVYTCICAACICAYVYMYICVYVLCVCLWSRLGEDVNRWAHPCGLVGGGNRTHVLWKSCKDSLTFVFVSLLCAFSGCHPSLQLILGSPQQWAAL